MGTTSGAPSIEALFNLTLAVFIVGNLLGMGLDVVMSEARTALGNRRFVVQSLVWGFVLCPALAWLLVWLIPMPAPYGIGLMLLGLAPCAPFLPMVTRQAGGDMAYAVALMLLTAFGTVAFMPLAVPVLVRGFSADTWTIAKPLVVLIALPLALGMLARSMAPSVATRASPIVKMVTTVDTVAMFALIFWLYGGDFVGAVGSYAIGGQVLFYVLVTIGAYMLGGRLPASQRSVMALGVSTRNIGAALAPLMSVAGSDRRAITMCILAIPLTAVVAFAASAIFRRVEPTG